MAVAKVLAVADEQEQIAHLVPMREARMMNLPAVLAASVAS
jgi:hypothetical protein